MDKPFLLAQLDHTAHNFILGLAAATLFRTPDVYPILAQAKAAFGTYEAQFKDIVALMESPTDGPLATQEFLKLHLRALIKETFEHIKAYARQSGQLAKMQTASWYHFARVIRNCLSHDGKFTFSKVDKAVLPFTWEGRSITPAMEGQDLEFAFFTPADGWKLFSAMREFAANTLA